MKKRKQDPEPFSHQPFRSLEQLLNSHERRGGSTRTKPAAPASGDDRDLFLEAMKEVHEIREFRELAVRNKNKMLQPRKPAHGNALQELEDIVKGKGSLRLADTQEYVEWMHPRYRRELLRELHGGKFAVQDYLDLHGYILEDAEAAVQDFLLRARRRGFHCVKIIHGRGLTSPKGPVLKKAVTDLLASRFRKYVMGFCTARPNDGGLGALYILLL